MYSGMDKPPSPDNIVYSDIEIVVSADTLNSDTHSSSCDSSDLSTESLTYCDTSLSNANLQSESLSYSLFSSGEKSEHQTDINISVTTPRQGGEQSTDIVGMAGFAGRNVADRLIENDLREDLINSSNILHRKAMTNSAKATMYKLLNIILSLAVILMSIVIGAYESFQEGDKNIPVIVVSFSIAGVNSVRQFFGIDKRGMYYKALAIKMSTLSKNAKNGASILVDIDKLTQLRNIVAKEMDELELESYKIGYSPQSDAEREDTLDVP